MGIAQDAAPEIDRLVLTVNRAVESGHGDRLRQIAREVGLDTLDLLIHFGDFLLAGRLTRDLALLRMRYLPSELVLARLDELESKELIGRTETGLAATPAMTPVLEAMMEATADVAGAAWSGHPDEVTTATDAAAEVAGAASDDHPVAATHRDLPTPADRNLLLWRRLVTLRYVRQHDHAEAWLARDLTPAAMVVMTQMWNGDSVAEPGDGIARLVVAGWATEDPPSLTETGRQERDAIETETNDRAEQSFDVLSDDAAAEFLAALRRLPDA